MSGPEVWEDEVEDWQDLLGWYEGSDEILGCGLEHPEVCESCQ